MIREIRADGWVLLDDGRLLRIAGVRMRSVEQTKDPDGLSNALRIATSKKPEVKVDLPGGGRTALIFYRQALEPEPIMAMSGLQLFRPSSEWMTLGELLIDLGLAYPDGANVELPPVLRERYRLTYLEYARAVYADWPTIYSQDYVRRPAVLCVDGEFRFRARIAPGDRWGRGSAAWRRVFDPEFASSLGATQPGAKNGAGKSNRRSD